jgi:hypothetical protein
VGICCCDKDVGREVHAVSSSAAEAADNQRTLALGGSGVAFSRDVRGQFVSGRSGGLPTHARVGGSGVVFSGRRHHLRSHR